MKRTITKRVTIEAEPETVHERLYWVRLDQRLTQESWAEVMGTSRSNAANKESGAVKYTIDDLIELSQCFDINMNWLFFGEGRPYRTKK